MLSMTGFGTATVSAASGTVTVQIATVNNRACQISLKSELRDLALEEAVRRQVREALTRGSITVHVAWQANQTLGFDAARVRQAWRELAALAHELGAPPPSLERVVALQGSARSEGPADLEQPVLAALGRCLAAVQAMRRQEGAALRTAFQAHAARLRELVAAMRACAPARLARVREGLVVRLREALGAAPPIAEDVLARELALVADRLDVSEELVRLDSHLAALDALLVSEDDALGRKLEFLLQELGREVNTTGSKSNDVTLTRVVLDAKAVLEQMREQAANVA